MPLDGRAAHRAAGRRHRAASTATGVMYTLNGLGPNGSITGGKPSRGAPPAAAPRGARARALHVPLPRRRRHGRRAAAAAAAGRRARTARDDRDRRSRRPQALFYRPGDLSRSSAMPLGATIPAADAAAGDDRRPPEAQRIDALTRSNLFLASFQQGQDAQRVPRAATACRAESRGSCRGTARTGTRGYSEHARVGRSSAVQSADCEPRPVRHDLLVRAGVAAAGGRPQIRRWPSRASSSWCWVTRCLTGSASGRACTSPHIASAACSAVSGVARRAHLVDERELEPLDLLLGRALAQRRERHAAQVLVPGALDHGEAVAEGDRVGHRGASVADDPDAVAPRIV